MDIKDILTDAPTEKIVPGFGPTNADVFVLGAVPTPIAQMHTIKNVLMPYANINPSLCRFETVMQDKLFTVKKPTLEQIRKERPMVLARIAIIKPKIIFALGKLAMLSLDIKGPLSVLHGTTTKIIFGTQQYIVYSMYDPEAAVLNPDLMPSLVSDWKKLGAQYMYYDTLKVDPVDAELEEEGWMQAPKALQSTIA